MILYKRMAYLLGFTPKTLKTFIFTGSLYITRHIIFIMRSSSRLFFLGVKMNTISISNKLSTLSKESKLTRIQEVEPVSEVSEDNILNLPKIKVLFKEQDSKKVSG